MLRSPRRRSAAVFATFLAAALVPLAIPTSASAAVSSVAITDPANDTVQGDPATVVDAPKADITAASVRYQNDHITFTMKTREGDDLSDPESRLWWVIGSDDACCAFVSLMKAPDGFVRVVMGDPGTTPSPADTSRNCAGSAASSDTALGTYTASIPASCLTTEPFPAFKWSAGRRVPTAGTETASDFAPDDELAAVVTNAPVTGYWAIGSGGKVYNFGDAPKLGEPAPAAAIDIDAAPHGAGYRTVDEKGVVQAFGLEAFQPVLYGNVTDLKVNEKAVSISGTPTGAGYWIFTNTGRVIAFGDAKKDIGDVSTLTLNREILDSSPTPSGNGYYMVAADGGVFALGDAEFEGSMGAIPLNQPVQSIVPDPDGKGYWLVASDGGVFAFEAPFKGSMGATPLNQPMSGMVPFGNGYLMVAEDGGVFNFSDQEFSGSLGNNPPTNPVVSITALN